MAARFCAYCGKELTDAASMNVGVGPICRKMENHVLAALIPADVGLARFIYRKLEDSMDKFPAEAHATVDKIWTDLADAENKDWRTTCKRVEWLLSFSVPKSVREALISIVDALGYVSLASLLNGEAAKGKATVTFEGGRIFIKGPRNKAGRLALRAIKGRKFHAESKRWSVPADKADEFKKAVWKHWPNNEGLNDAIGAAYEFEASKVEEAEALPPVAAPKVTVVNDGTVLKIASPYNKGFIAALKAEILVWKERRWNPAEKVWEVAPVHAETVKALIAKHYGEEVAF